MDSNHMIVNLSCSNNTKTAWQMISKILMECGIKCSKLLSNDNGFKAFLSSQSDIDKLFSDSSLSKLKHLNCIPVKSGSMRKNCTVFVKNVDPFIMELNESELLSNLNEMNRDNLKALSLKKLPSGKTLKFECETSEMAATCLRDGVKLCQLFVNQNFLSLETENEVNYCYRCYEIDSHKANNCPKPREYVVCSNCSGNHKYKNCHHSVRKCINCSGAHATMSKNCPKYKNAVSKKANTTSTVENKTHVETRTKNYSAIHTNSTNTHDSYANATKHGLSREDMFRGYMCLLMATSMEASMPGSFNTSFDKLLAENGLPSFKTAGLIPSVTSQCLASSSNNMDPTPVSSQTTQNNKNTNNPSKPTQVNNNNNTENNKNSTSHNTIPTSSAFVKDKIITFEPSPRPIRVVAQKKCIIHVKKTEKTKILQRKNLMADLTANNAVIEHNCPDETKCIQSLSKYVSDEETTSLSIKDHTKNQFENIVSQFGDSEC